MKPVICLEMLYPELAFNERVSRAAAHGFDRIEDSHAAIRSALPMVADNNSTGIRRGR